VLRHEENPIHQGFADRGRETKSESLFCDS
jgi:hypothetical protein